MPIRSFRPLSSNRRQGELFEARRISKYIDLDHLSACNREGQHRKRLPVKKRDNTRSSIHERRPNDQAKPREGEGLPGDGLRAADYSRRAGRSEAAVDPENDLGIEHGEKGVEVAAVR